MYLWRQPVCVSQYNYILHITLFVKELSGMNGGHHMLILMTTRQKKENIIQNFEVESRK